ncbi:MAG TPA: hypothetical protein PL017_03610 [Tenuifilaceae bacterium]|nr:hypothetical protein [Tenuifilaceae bacterium]HPE17469.1 hypothetical protein [Tenuifilaceae bacterium]HPJ45160.1 hypothetical protein [Tenuifilaceae bacterium]HPQ33453.1 hypothetical protein [Tenuifilaceae bacterium]HRX67015.1 hypothetical protein [Tenuifilaceae bacterium]
MKTKLLLFALLTVFVAFTGCKEEEPTYTLTVTVSPEGAGTVTGAGEYEEGKVVALTATANEGYEFVNWTIGDTELSTEASYSYTTTAADVTITANFVMPKIVTLGAQDSETPGFLSVSTGDVYTLEQAYANQAAIDIFCFYEVGNDIALAGPNSNITGVFSDEADNDPTDPANWETKNETRYFEVTTLTVEQFDALADGDESIQSYYNEDEGKRKAKMLAVDDIYAFKTADATYGLLKVTAVVDGATGSVTFEYKVK